MRAPSTTTRRIALRSRRSRWVLVLAVVIVLALLASAQRIATFYTDFLWYRALGFSGVWSKTVTVQVGLGVVFTAVFFGIVWGNLTFADKSEPVAVPGDQLVSRWHEVAGRYGTWVRAIVAGLFALVGGASAHSQWDNWLLFSNAKPFPGKTDPIFHLNYGFYVFRLPFLQWLVGWVFSALVVTFFLSSVAHYLNGGIRPYLAAPRVSARVKAHLSVLMGVIALVQGANYYLQRLALVTRPNYPPVDGATYTDVHAVSPALVLLVAISVIAAGLFFYNARQQGWLLPSAGVAVWAIVWLLAGNLYPAVVQRWVVEPSQNTKEAAYITDNIQATLFAYGLSSVQDQNYPSQPTLASADIQGNSPQSVADRQTLANIPLLDAATSELGAVFDRLQVMRGYYTMSPPSPDRYVLATGPGGRAQETPVLISARELYYPSGVSRPWVNQHLEYTHGYGAVASPSNQAGVASSGYPAFTLGGLPPAGQPALGAQPRVYFGTSGQLANGYVVAGSNQPELDYEDASTGVQKYYQGYSSKRSPTAGGALRRLAFALRFGDANFLLSGQITASSKVLYYRNVTQRLEKVAPFLAYDSQPYPVVTNGSLYWVEDAYTLSDSFPYAERADTARLSSSSGLAQQPFNYVRNSVKAVVDAYSGRVWLFVQDPEDPVLQTYEAAFPRLFTPMSEANAQVPGITQHWRYAYDLFVVQTNMWSSYHQQDAPTFFSNSQQWAIPQYPGGAYPYLSASNNHYMMPVYELMALPGTTNQSFVLVQPFVPASNGSAQTLTAVMTAGPDYGELTDYVAPPGQAVHGPQSVVTSIVTNKSISYEISLLGRDGSNVVLGSLVTVPLAGSLLYVEPLYVSTKGGIPRLEDVIVEYNNNVYHSGNPSLPEALCQVRNPDGTSPFTAYCEPSAKATRGRGTTAHPARPASRAATSHSGPTSTTASAARQKPSSTTTAPPTTRATGSVGSYLAQAQEYFAAAQRALSRGDLSSYQSAINAAAAAVAQAQQAARSGTTTTTTGVGVKTTTPVTTSTTATTGTG